jgi:hypothetical protein
MTHRLFIAKTDQLILFMEEICVPENRAKHINKLSG